jgi:meso-butanediol dehydrogenase/(S,S)-butanediol dehydrogenase/diacetyl reductase
VILVKSGRIINIASQAVRSGFAHGQAYNASKHGLVGLARSAAIDLGGSGLAQDRANAAALLNSDRAYYITAKSMNLSGGEEPH